MKCIKCSRESKFIFRDGLDKVGRMCIDCAVEIIQATPYRNINVRCRSGVDENLRRVIDEAFCTFEKIRDQKNWVSEVKELWIIVERDLMEPTTSQYCPSRKRIVVVTDEITGRTPALSLVHEFLHAKHVHEINRFYGKVLNQVRNDLIFKPPTTSNDLPKRKYAWMSIIEAAVESLAEETKLISEEAEKTEMMWKELTKNKIQELSRLSNHTLILILGTCLLVAKRAKSNSLLQLMESRINSFPSIREGAHEWTEIALRVNHFNTTNWENLMREFESLFEKYK